LREAWNINGYDRNVYAERFNHVAFRARESAGNKRKVRARSSWESNRRRAHQLQMYEKKDQRVKRATIEICV